MFKKKKTYKRKTKLPPTQDENELVAKVKSLKNPTAQKIKSTHELTFALFAFAQGIAIHLLTYWQTVSPGLEIVKFLITLIIDTFLYIAIYTIVKQVQEIRIDQKQKQFSIQGLWYHIHIPHFLGEIDYNHDTLRCGMTVIRRDLYDFSMSACNYSFKIDEKSGKKSALIQLEVTTDSPKTEWHTIISELSDSTDASYDLIQIYRANSTVDARMKIRKCPCCQSDFETEITVPKAEKFRYGIHKFRVADSIANSSFARIEGTYEDCWPSLNCGEILLFRSKDERDKKALAYFDERKKRLSSKDYTQ